MKRNYAAPESATVAAEIVGTSITSPGFAYDQLNSLMPFNPHIRFFDSRHRGYVECVVTQDVMTVNLRVVDDIRDPNSAARTLKRLVVENGRAGLQEV